jgi:glycosyltransferase involved in cell wall biosynthesis
MKSSIGSEITPLILSYNEESNIGRTLKSLRWADRVVIIDSGSVDRTEEIARTFPNVDWKTRKFDSFKSQTEYGIHSTGIDTDYVLALDADMVVSEGLACEIEERFLNRRFAGGLVPFKYCVSGRPLPNSLYPAQIRLFERNKIEVLQVGHGHNFQIDGPVYQFKSPLFHDDRKPIDRWLASQLSYSTIEAERIKIGSPPRWHDRLRKLGLMPPVIAILAYIRAGGPLGGTAAIRYAYERALYECLLAIRLTSARLERDGGSEE